QCGGGRSNFREPRARSKRPAGSPAGAILRAMRRILPLIVVLFLAACSRTTDEQRIRASITAMQQALEQREPRAFMAHVSDASVGNDASFDRAALHNFLRAEVLRNDNIGVTLGPIDVQIEGSRATVRVTATFTGGSGGLLPDRASVYAITSGWKRNG